mmetsp:Transcript_35701/g.90992  ORF Transcript_35701/g.90992 Transcript_35701/m.90992 type:complete len:222 (-) Transcript_35701:199-864(-)
MLASGERMARSQSLPAGRSYSPPPTPPHSWWTKTTSCAGPPSASCSRGLMHAGTSNFGFTSPPKEGFRRTVGETLHDWPPPLRQRAAPGQDSSPHLDPVGHRGSGRMTAVHLTLWGEPAGRSTVELDQPHVSRFLAYSRNYGMALRYAGERDSRFTDDVYTHGPAVQSKTLSKCSQRTLTDLRRAARSQPHLAIRTTKKPQLPAPTETAPEPETEIPVEGT